MSGSHSENPEILKCAEIASSLEEDAWSAIMAKLDSDTLKKLQGALREAQASQVSADTDEKLSPEDATESLKKLNAKLTKFVKSAKKKFALLEQQNKELIDRVTEIENSDDIDMDTSLAVATGKTTDRRASHAVKAASTKATTSHSRAVSDASMVKRKPRKLKTMANHDELKESESHSGSSGPGYYQFGSRKLHISKPANYPSKKEAQRPVEGKLSLFYAHGYSGNFEDSRQNIYFSLDGTQLIYYIAAVAVVFDWRQNTQKFFTKHNDDITTLCVSPNQTWAATGQKDPKDVHGEGKDLPKVWVWDYSTTPIKPIKLIDNVCWGKIARLQWSKTSNRLYCICGDDHNTLKAWNASDFTSKKEPHSILEGKAGNDIVFGFELNDTPNKAYVDEFIVYGKRKFAHCGVGGHTAKARAVPTSAVKKTQEKAYTCAVWLPDGRYLVGASSGSIYVGRQAECLSVIASAHSRSLGCLLLTKDQNWIISAGHDKMLKRWQIRGTSAATAAVAVDADNNSNGDDDSKLEALVSSADESDMSDADSKKRKKSVTHAKSKSLGAAKLKQSHTALDSKKKKTSSKKVEVSKTSTKVSSVKKPAAPIVEKWSHEVFIADTDYRLQPRAMVFDDANGTLFVGSKTNQIMKFEMSDNDASVVVDGHDGAVWGLCTHPTQRLYATGGYDNAIKLWDADTTRCVLTYEFEKEADDKTGHEISCGHWSNDGKVLVFGTENTSCILVFSFELSAMELQFQQKIFIGPKSANAVIEPVSYIRFAADSSVVGVAHMDANLYLYNVQCGDDKVLLQQWPMPLGHVAAPSHVQFSADGSMVKTLTRDYEVVHWALDHSLCRGKFVPNVPSPDRVKWADDPLIAGWDVEGLYQKQLLWDGTDLNDATLTSDGRLIASGDDYGKVRLHNYPSTDLKTCQVYGGHCEFVVGVEFLRDDSQLITAGGEDMAIFQWKLHKNYKD